MSKSKSRNPSPQNALQIEHANALQIEHVNSPQSAGVNPPSPSSQSPPYSQSHPHPTHSPYSPDSRVSKTPFCQIPNSLILYSISQNKYILPVYIYSWINRSQYNDDTVNLNLSLLSEILATDKLQNGVSTSIKEALKILGRDNPDITLPSGSTLKGFSKCIIYSPKYDGVKSTTRLKYRFLSRAIKFTSGYTMLNYDEYYHIIEWADSWNMECAMAEANKFYGKADPWGGKDPHKRINTADIINLYCYMKYKISLYSSVSDKNEKSSYLYKYHDKKLFMKESVKTIAENFGMGDKTISKYIGLLINELKMLKLEKDYGDVMESSGSGPSSGSGSSSSSGPSSGSGSSSSSGPGSSSGSGSDSSAEQQLLRPDQKVRSKKPGRPANAKTHYELDYSWRN